MRALLVLLTLSWTAGAASADRLEIGAGLGYAAPVGSAERGSRVSDTTIGQFPIVVDGAYRLTRAVRALARVRYGLAVPRQCASASECVASLGSDVSIEIGARFVVRRIVADATVGYEWLTTKLVDADATATRAYRGPLLLSVAVAAPFALGKGWTLGPTLGASIGRFTWYALDTNALSPSGDIPDGAWHAWLSLGVRVGWNR
jgi:hypothetical protein